MLFADSGRLCPEGNVLSDALGGGNNAHQADLIGIAATGEVVDGSIEALENGDGSCFAGLVCI